MANLDVEAIDFEPDEDDLMDDDTGDVSPNRGGSNPRLKSAITGGGSSSAPKRTKGRGFRDEATAEAERNARMSARFDTLDSEGGPGPERSVEGWIVLVTGVHEEAQEEDLHVAFGDYGIKNLHLNLDRRTGFVKGYALIEFENFENAQSAIREWNEKLLLDQTIYVDWAFSKGPFKRKNMRRRSPRSHRSRSPRRRF